jgi:hypothetical protein
VRYSLGESEPGVKNINFSTILKWVGYTTAILSLIFGIRELFKLVSDRVEARRKVDELLVAEEVELKSLDYASAWRSLDQASQVQPNSEKVRHAQENVAMAWLEDVHLREGEKFSDIAAKLEPVLTRGLASSKDSQRAGDLLAHIGWAYFLRSRDSVFGLDPAGDYSQAVDKDPNNPYAEAMWGHLILWNHGKLGDASKHFSAALVSGRHRDFVRSMQFAALFNCPNDECNEEIIRVANDVRKEHGEVEADDRGKIFFIYYRKMLLTKSESRQFLNVVPPAEHLATFRWLFDGLDLDESKSLQRKCYLAEIQEAAGQKEEALANFRAVRSNAANYHGALVDAANDGIKRLSAVH